MKIPTDNCFTMELSALRHPNPRGFDWNDEKQYRSLVVWLEDQKIRHHKIEDRENLRNIESDTWKADFDTYQKKLASPVRYYTPKEQLYWIVTYAIRLEFMAKRIISKYRN